MKIYHTETQEDYDALMVELEEQGFTWWHYIGEKPTDNNYWNNNKENTCVRAIPKDKELMTMHKKHYITEYPQTPIEKYKAKVDEKMKFTKENVEKVINDYFRQAGFESCGDLIAEIHNLDDTPEKVVVRKFVAEFYEKCEDAPLSFLITQLEATDSRSELGKWYSSCSGRHRNGRANAQEIIARMKLYGYEVEEEPLYCVKINGQYLAKMIPERNVHKFVEEVNLRIWDPQAYELTEAEIKKIDERYIPFMVPVDEVNKD